MDFNIEIRKKQLDNLDQLISSSRKRIQSVLNYLGWTEEKVEEGNVLIQCPINPHHKISSKSWNEHIEKCVIKFEGYNLNSQFLSESVNNPTQSIYLDRNKKIEVITKELAEKGALRLAWNGLDPDPRTADRLVSTYSPDERLIFYNYAIANTEGPPPPPEFTTLLNNKQNDEKPLTYEEILIQERDAKRRRAKYKSVHINRKNHTEVIRELINGQMEEYKEWLLTQKQSKNTEECNSHNGYDDIRKEEQERPHSSISRNSNHSSSSRSTSRKYEQHRDRRDPSRERYHKSRSYENKNKYEERRRHSSDERRHRYNHSNETRRSKERERRYSSKERRRHGYDDVRRQR